MKSANIIYKLVVKLIIFVIGLTIGVFSANAFNQLVFPPINQNDVKPLLENVKDYKLPDNDKPNPLIIGIRADKDGTLLLNDMKLGTFDNLDLLSNELKYIFKTRKDHSIFVEFSDEVVKEVIIVPESTIQGEDLYNLVEALESSGANPILIDWNNESPDMRLVAYRCNRWKLEAEEN